MKLQTLGTHRPVRRLEYHPTRRRLRRRRSRKSTPAPAASAARSHPKTPPSIPYSPCPAGNTSPCSAACATYTPICVSQPTARQTAERKKNGGLATNPDRMGPLSMRARKHFFGEILKIQTEINSAATAINRPVIDILNPEEIEFIRKCWSENTAQRLDRSRNSGRSAPNPKHSATAPYNHYYSIKPRPKRPTTPTIKNSARPLQMS